MGLLRCASCQLVFEGAMEVPGQPPRDARCPQCGADELEPALPAERRPPRETSKTQKMRPIPREPGDDPT